MILDITQKALRLFFGYVMFEASGGFPDRFFDSCRASGIDLFDVTRKNGNIYAGVRISDYKRMPSVRKNSDMSLHIVEKRGLPFVIYKRRSRVGLAAGVIIFIIILCVLSGMLLSIDVDGNVDVDENEIIKAFEENGVRVGARIKKIDITDVENRVCAQIPELAWVSLNISGTVAQIKVREGVRAPEIARDEKPCNIIAKYGGQISQYEVYEGTAEQEINAAVSKGDLLISGIITYKDGTTVLRPARGKVFAKTERTLSFMPNEDFDIFYVKRIIRSYTLDFFGMRYTSPCRFFRKGQGCVYGSEYEERAYVNGVGIPVCISENHELVTGNAVCDGLCGDTRKKSVFFDAFLREIRENTDIETIRECDVNFDDNGKMAFIGTFSMVEDIGETVELLYTES